VVQPGEEEVSIPESTSVVVPPKEEEFSAPAVVVLSEEESVPVALLVMVPSKGRGSLVPVPALVSSLPFFFSQKRIGFFTPFFLINVVDL
jgi:hypothetical protein